MSYAIRKDGTGWRAINSVDDVLPDENFSADQPAIIQVEDIVTVSPWQIRKALNQLGLRTFVEQAVSSSSQDVKDGWEFATEFRVNDPLVVQLGVVLGKTTEDLIGIFTLAKSL